MVLMVQSTVLLIKSPGIEEMVGLCPLDYWL